MIVFFEILCTVGMALMVCALDYEQRRSPYTWIIGALAVGFTGDIVWNAATDWLHTFTVVR